MEYLEILEIQIPDKPFALFALQHHRESHKELIFGSQLIQDWNSQLLFILIDFHILHQRFIEVMVDLEFCGV